MPDFLKLELEISSAEGHRSTSLRSAGAKVIIGAVGVLLSDALGLTSLSTIRILADALGLLGVRHAVTWRLILRDHENFAICRALVVGREADSDLLKLSTIRRSGSPSSAARLPLVDPLPQMTGAESVPRTLVIGARHVERVTGSTRDLL